MVTAFPTCVESENVLCKHVRATRTYYADLSFLPAGVTVVSATADSADASIIIGSVTVLSTDLIETGCTEPVLLAGRALLIVLSGGTPSDDEILVTIDWEQSDGDADSRDVRLIVGGRA